MNIQEMHNAFRILGQQSGMQTVRGILPENIDIYINNAIGEKIQQEFLVGVHTALQDSVNTQSITMSNINTFRTLYKTVRYKIDTKDTGDYKKVAYYNPSNGYHIIRIPTLGSSIDSVDQGEYKIDPMMFTGFSVEYDNTLRGNAIACRMIGSDVLETTLRDYCNGASKDSPIVCLMSEPSLVSGLVESSTELSNEQIEVYTGTKNCSINYINIKYIKAPNVVKFDMDIDKCVNCDLPSYTHFDIVEKAVQKYFISVGAQQYNPNRREQQSQQ